MKKPKKPVVKRFSLSCPRCRSNNDIRYVVGSSNQLYCGSCHTYSHTSPALAKLISSIFEISQEHTKAEIRASIGIVAESRSFTIRS